MMMRRKMEMMNNDDYDNDYEYDYNFSIDGDFEEI